MFKREEHDALLGQNSYIYAQEFESRWMSIERKSIWTVRVINERYVYCYSLKCVIL